MPMVSWFSHYFLIIYLFQCGVIFIKVGHINIYYIYYYYYYPSHWDLKSHTLQYANEIMVQTILHSNFGRRRMLSAKLIKVSTTGGGVCIALWFWTGLDHELSLFRCSQQIYSLTELAQHYRLSMYKDLLNEASSVFSFWVRFSVLFFLTRVSEDQY